MNKKLKFSWGHIIAFLALIFISYVSFMGLFYKSGGNFIESITKILIIDIAIFAVFMGAQILKGTERKFYRSIIIERILILLTPIVLFIAMKPNNHFWNIFSQRAHIETLFKGSISTSKKMFDDYDVYANERIENYSNLLDKIIRNKNSNPGLYARASFDGANDEIRKDNYIHTLRLQLLSQNSNTLQEKAVIWLNNSNKEATIWNAFLIGNISQISKAIEGWNEELVKFSTPILSNETLNGNEVFPFNHNISSSKEALNNLELLTAIYKSEKIEGAEEQVKTNNINYITIILFVILIFMLLLPYFIQKRHTKNPYTLISKKEKDTENDKIENINPPQQINTNTQNTSQNNEDDPYSGTF